MANIPKRIQDPTEAAMSAIQEALNLRDDPPVASAGRTSESAPPTAPGADPFASIAAAMQTPPPRENRSRPARSAPPIDDDLFLQETVGQPAAQPFGRAPAPAPADIDEVRPTQR